MTNRSFFSETSCVVVCSNLDTTGINPSEICFGDNDKHMSMALRKSGLYGLAFRTAEHFPDHFDIWIFSPEFA